MNNLIQAFFTFLATAFDQIPFLNKLKGYRSAIGLLLLAVVEILSVMGVIPPDIKTNVNQFLIAFTGLALNAKSLTGKI